MRLSIFLAISVFIVGCGPKTFEPLYVTPPAVPASPSVDYIPEREIPTSERKQLWISLDQSSTPDSDDYFNNPGAVRGSDGSSPSVIISVPNEAVQSEAPAQGPSTSGDLNEVYRTDGYYNEAEQAIEAALLRKGFNVLDRSKFEAKLRDLRDRANETPLWWSNYDRLIENKEYDALKTIIAKELESGKISQSEYIERITEVDQISQIGLPGEKRTEDEMIDIAEVIRAAQTGADRADYLLQINGVTVSDAGNRMLSIQGRPEVVAFMNENPGLTFGSTPGTLPSSIPSRWLRVVFNAKLINVQSGSIAWLGSHELESWAAEPIRIMFDVQRRATNDDEVNGPIRSHNSGLRALNQRLINKTSELEAAYREASTEREFAEATELAQHRDQLISNIARLEKEHEQLSSQLEAASRQPNVLGKSWVFEYDVSEPVIEPNLLAAGLQSVAGEQRLLQHRRVLVREVTQELIRTIVIQ